MKLQSASRKEIARISKGTFLLDLILIGGLFLLSQLGVGSFSIGKILLSTVIGSLVAIGNFTLMCLTVQSEVGMTDMKKMKAKFQLSYNARMIMQAGWAVIAFLVPAFHFIAGAAPVLFPKLTILYLNFTGRLMPPSEPSQAEEASQEAPSAAEAESE